jgi:hypothetical protein
MLTPDLSTKALESRVLKAVFLVIQGRELEGAHHLHLVLRIKVSEAIRSLPHMSS